jgi:ribosomal protein L4
MKIIRIMLLLAGAGIFAASPGAFAQPSDPHHPAPSASSKQVDAPSKKKSASKKRHRMADQGMMDCPMMRGGRSMHGSMTSHMHGSKMKMNCPMMHSGHAAHKHSGAGHM